MYDGCFLKSIDDPSDLMSKRRSRRNEEYNGTGGLTAELNDHDRGSPFINLPLSTSAPWCAQPESKTEHTGQGAGQPTEAFQMLEPQPVDPMGRTISCSQDAAFPKTTWLLVSFAKAEVVPACRGTHAVAGKGKCGMCLSTTCIVLV